jgi:hypothetical protein
MGIFKLSTGKTVQSTGTAEMAGGNMEPIPDGTKVKAIITEAKWDSYQGDKHIKLRWDVVDGEYKKRVIFQKVKVMDPDDAKADRQKTMLAAIDANAGGKLAALDKDEPSDVDLQAALCNKVMVIRLAVWEMNDKSGNWVSAVQSAGAQPAPAPAPIHAAPAAEVDADIDF